MISIGLDVHWKTTSLCILDDNGKVVKEITLRGSFDETVTYLRKTLTEPAAVVFEATGHYGFIYDSLAKVRQIKRILMAHPGAVRLIFKSKRKNDRLDAKRLAKLLFLDEVPTAYVPSAEIRHWREMIEYRQSIIRSVIGCKNRIRALLRRQGIVAVRGLWSKQGLAWLAAVEMDDAPDFQRDMLLDELVPLLSRRDKVTRRLNKIGKTYSGVALLRTIPGVGPRTAEAVVAYVADPHRFSNIRSIGSYFGLVPRQDESAGKRRLGHITKEGPVTVRHLLVEASWVVIRKCPSIARKFDQMCHGQKERRKIALIGIARQLSCVMLSMLKTGEVWSESRSVTAASSGAPGGTLPPSSPQ
jgi:transposase